MKFVITRQLNTQSKTVYLGVEAGAQGEHKLARGYMPNHTYSLHWINNSNFSTAVAQYLDEERKAVGQEMEILSDYGPFKDLNIEEKK